MTDTPLASSSVPPQGLLAQRTQQPVSRAAGRGAFWRMLSLLWPHRRVMTLGLVLSVGVALTYAASLGGLLPVLKVVVERESLRQWLLERAAASHAWYTPVLRAVALYLPIENTPAMRMRSLVWIIVILVAINLVGNVLRCFSQYLILYASNRAMMDLRRKLYRKALHAPMTELVGDVSTRVNHFMSDVREVFLGVTTLFGKIAREPLKAICVLALALWLDARLTLIVLAIAPPAVLLLWYFGRRVRKAAVKLLAGYGVMLSGLEESLQGLDVVKGYRSEGHERRRMWRLERRMMKQQLKLAWIESLSSPLIEVIGVAVAAGGIVWLASRVLLPESDPAFITPSRFMTMVILLSAMLDPIRKVANVYNMVQRAGAGAARLFAFLDQPDEPRGRRGGGLAAGAARELRFEHVTFRYAPDAPPALHDVSLHVRPGECIAIVGPNGSGKSTLTKLLPRLLEPQQGAIRIDGVDLRELSLRALRREIAIVSQRPVLFARSVRENIAYGDAATDDMQRVRDAAARAYAAEFIEAWPQQYETVLGEHGQSISGGQRQRIAIARAFLKPATILIFDEATSEIDAESERKIHAALADLRRGKTTFLIAHRHTVMELAERIAVMDAGRVVDFGTHTELLTRCPLYVALYRSPTPH